MACGPAACAAGAGPRWRPRWQRARAVLPSLGTAPARSAELGAGLYGDRAAGRNGPHLACRAALDRSAHQIEGRGVEQGGPGTHAEGADRTPRIVIADEIGEAGLGERPVHDQAGIAFHLHGIGAVVVDAMCVAGEDPV